MVSYSIALLTTIVAKQRFLSDHKLESKTGMYAEHHVRFVLISVSAAGSSPGGREGVLLCGTDSQEKLFSSLIELDLILNQV